MLWSLWPDCTSCLLIQTHSHTQQAGFNHTSHSAVSPDQRDNLHTSLTQKTNKIWTYPLHMGTQSSAIKLRGEMQLSSASCRAEISCNDSWCVGSSVNLFLHHQQPYQTYFSMSLLTAHYGFEVGFSWYLFLSDEWRLGRLLLLFGLIMASICTTDKKLEKRPLKQEWEHTHKHTQL